MTTISRLNVEVRNIETEIIESTLTSTSEARTFGVGNKGEKEIIATAWGSDDGDQWNEEESKSVPPNTYKNLIVGPTHHGYVKLTGRTTNPDETSIVDGYLTYSEPTA
jgi:hypothetical protein